MLTIEISILCEQAGVAEKRNYWPSDVPHGVEDRVWSYMLKKDKIRLNGNDCSALRCNTTVSTYISSFVWWCAYFYVLVLSSLNKEFSLFKLRKILVLCVNHIFCKDFSQMASMKGNKKILLEYRKTGELEKW